MTIVEHQAFQPSTGAAGWASGMTLGGSAPGRVITVLSAKGGTGKTTIAAGMAMRLAAAMPDPRGAPIAVVDLDVGYGNLAPILGLQAGSGLRDLAPNPTLDAVESVLARHPSGVQLLAGPTDPVGAEAVDPATCAYAIRHLAHTRRAVVVDTPPGLTEATLTAMELADLVVVPITAEPSNLEVTAASLACLSELGLAAPRLRLVLNRVTPDRGQSRRAVAAALGIPALVELPYTQDLAMATARGRILALDWPEHPFTQALGRLASTTLPTAPQLDVQGVRRWLRKVAS